MKPISYVKPNKLPSFIEEWAEKYNDPLECVYERYIKRELDEESIMALYIWKNGSPLFRKKTVEDNYIEFINSHKKCLPTDDELEKRYLNADEAGGAIWNIFFLHILSPKKYPIFDQHVYRAMHFMQIKQLDELPKDNKGVVYKKYKDYKIFYNYLEEKTRPHLEKIGDPYDRKIDRALFKFGQFLSKIDSDSEEFARLVSQ